jgi:hypothetical protein
MEMYQAQNLINHRYEFIIIIIIFLTEAVESANKKRRIELNYN